MTDTVKPLYVVCLGKHDEIFLLNTDSGSEFFRSPDTVTRRKFLREKQAEANHRASFNKMGGLI
jgi:hypothetical protein